MNVLKQVKCVEEIYFYGGRAGILHGSILWSLLHFCTFFLRVFYLIFSTLFLLVWALAMPASFSSRCERNFTTFFILKKLPFIYKKKRTSLYI